MSEWNTPSKHYLKFKLPRIGIQVLMKISNTVLLGLLRRYNQNPIFINNQIISNDKRIKSLHLSSLHIYNFPDDIFNEFIKISSSSSSKNRCFVSDKYPLSNEILSFRIMVPFNFYYRQTLETTKTVWFRLRPIKLIVLHHQSIGVEINVQ